MGRLIRGIVAALGLTNSMAWANEDFTVGLSLDGRYTDNATRVAEEAAQVEELQTRAGLTATGALEGVWSRLDANLNLEHREYSEQTYDDQTRLLGGADVILGKPRGALELLLGYSSQEFLVNPTLGDVAENLDRRTTLLTRVTASGAKKTGSGPSVWVEHADVQLQLNDFADSRRLGWGAGYRREMPGSSAWGLEYETYDLEYVRLDEEFTLSKFSVLYERASRRWTMRSAIGVNEAGLEDDSETETEPFYELSLNYDAAVHVFNFDATSFISDTSQGGRANVERTLLTGGGLDGFIDEQAVDQFVSDSYSLGWIYNGLCAVCSVNTSAVYSSEEYFNFTEYDADIVALEVALAYSLNRAANLGVSVGNSEYNVASAAGGRGDYSEQNVRIGITFTNIVRDGSLGLEVANTKRDFDDAEGYNAAYVRASFHYQFL